MNFESLYRSHYDFVWRTLRRLGVCDRNVEDACQIVFLNAYRRLPQFEGRSSLKTWLCGISVKVASDYRRSASVRREKLVEPPPSEVPFSAEQQQQVEQRERLEEVDAILAQLPIEQRTVLVLHELEQLTGEEIATIEGLPLGTVRSRLRLAREAFLLLATERSLSDGKKAAGGHR